jgi:hypothetical protein
LVAFVNIWFDNHLFGSHLHACTLRNRIYRDSNN